MHGRCAVIDAVPDQRRRMIKAPRNFSVAARCVFAGIIRDEFRTRMPNSAGRISDASSPGLYRPLYHHGPMSAGHVFPIFILQELLIHEHQNIQVNGCDVSGPRRGRADCVRGARTAERVGAGQVRTFSDP
jgi:hypothetical protein